MTFDLGIYEPATTVAPINDPKKAEAVELSRLATTEEQRHMVMRWMIDQANEYHNDSVKATVKWANLEPTIVEITLSHEHLAGKLIRTLRTVTETELNGAEIHRSEAQRFAQLDAEVVDLVERKML